jgi:hypothetical protein
VWGGIACVLWLAAVFVPERYSTLLVFAGGLIVVVMLSSRRAKALWLRHVLRHPDPWLERDASDEEVRFAEHVIKVLTRLIRIEQDNVQHRANRTGYEVEIAELETMDAPSAGWSDLVGEILSQARALQSAFASGSRLDPRAEQEVTRNWDNIAAHLHALRNDADWPQTTSLRR